MSDLPPGLEDFGERLREAAERDVAERRRERRGRRLLRAAALPVAAALGAAAVTAGAVRIADREGDPIPAEPALTAQAPEDRTVVETTATADPGGGPPWIVRAFASGESECIQVGRLRDGVFGQVQNGRFRELPASAPARCQEANAPRPLIVVDRRPQVGLTLVYGLAKDSSPVTIESGGRVQRKQPAVFGAFVAVVDGADPREAIVVRSQVDGRSDVRRSPAE